MVKSTELQEINVCMGHHFPDRYHHHDGGVQAKHEDVWEGHSGPRHGQHNDGH